MASAHAGIVLGGTRVVYDGGKRDAALSITNPDTDPYAVQVWINDEKDDTTTPVPFVANPPLFRLATDKPNMLKIALRTRIKMFYRPAAVKGNPMDALSTLTWETRQQAGKPVLVVRNPSAFYISFIGIRIAGEEVRDPTMVAPMGEQVYPLTQAHAAGAEVMFSAINDHGGYTDPVTVKVQAAR
jgi:chaperone protein EcpD